MKNTKFKNDDLLEGKVFTILDIGSSKIVCLIAKISEKNIRIIASGCHSANGFKNGNISDPKLAKESVIAAVDQAERASGILVDKVVLSINGNKISSQYLKATIELNKQKVTDSDVNKLIAQAVADLEQKSFEIIHYFPLEYILDGNAGIKDPRGLIGKNLSAFIHFVTVSAPLIENIINCLAICQLDVIDCVFAPYASGLATLSSFEKEFGSTVIDIGSAITSYALFSQNKMVHSGFIPIGSSSVTSDIAKTFMIDTSSAERIKTMHGAASINYSDNQKMIHLSGSQEVEEQNILNSELNEVIKARIEEILILLKSVLDKEYRKFQNAQNAIILTGGGSLLTGISDQAALIFNNKVKLGKPVNIHGLKGEFVDSTFAAAIGALQYIVELNNRNSGVRSLNKSLFKRVIDWFKDNF